MLKTGAPVFAATILSMSFAGPALADSDKLAQGLATCGGNNFVRAPANTEQQFTRYNLRNFNDTQSVTVTRLLVFSGLGNVLFDSNVSGLPVSNNLLLGPGKNILGPHQTSSFFTEAFLPNLAPIDRPVQALITWSQSGGRPLDVESQVVTTGRDPVTGATLEERTRSTLICDQGLTSRENQQ